MKFQYTALTTDNKKITGVLDAPDKETAESELHRMGVAIIAVREITVEEYEQFEARQQEAKVKKGIKTFQFVAIDANAKEVEGTIDALDDFSAYNRLREEYKFTIKAIYPVNAAEDEKKHAESLIAGFEDQLVLAKSQVKKVEKRQTAKQAEEGVEEQEISQEIIAEIDRVIINTKKAIESHAGIFSSELLVEIENTLGELERIRTSNNIKHITEVSNDLYALISNPDKAEAGSAKDPNYQAILGEIKDSALVKKEFDVYKKALEASGVKHLFGDMTKRLKEMTAPKPGEEEKPGFTGKLKAKINAFLDQFSKRKIPKIRPSTISEKPASAAMQFIERLGAYFKATSPILKKTRRRELIDALKGLFGKKAPAAETVEQKTEVDKRQGAPAAGRNKKDFMGIFVEADSFLGWLLCFYIIYFFLVGFSIEKGIGLNREFVFKTLKSPLLFNITVFLVLAHFTLRIHNLHFRHNALASLFLFFMSIGVYILLMVNF